MRVAFVALVLIVGAAVMLAFANTLNSWVLGGLLGGLAALLLSIPISLALFTLLARRQEARHYALNQFFEDEPEFADDFYDERRVYEADGYLTLDAEDLPIASRAQYRLDERRLPASDYLRLPAAGQGLASYEDDLEPIERREPRNYPRYPRASSRSFARDGNTQVPSQPQRATQSGIRRRPSTHILAQHQSEALRAARQEARQERISSRIGSGSLTRRSPESRAQALQRTRASRQLRTQSSQSTSGSRRSLDERDTWVSEREDARSSWYDEDAAYGERVTDQFSTRYQQYPRHPSHPRQPRTGYRRTVENMHSIHEDEDEPSGGYRSRRDSDRLSGSIYNPLVRRPPYLYDDDPLREEFARQLEHDRPITRRSSRYEHYQQDEEW